MALKEWKRKKGINPYVTHSWINKKKNLMIKVHYDIGLGKQRNTTVYDLSDHRLSGFHDLKTYYGASQKDAVEWAMEYMRNN